MDNEAIVEWVEENFDPAEDTPENFVNTTSYRGKRFKVALNAAKKLALEWEAKEITRVYGPH